MAREVTLAFAATGMKLGCGLGDPAAPAVGAIAQPAAPLLVERVGFDVVVTLQPAWDDLIARAVEPNVFLDPRFAVPLLQHVRCADRPDFLLAREAGAPTPGRLVGLLPVHLPRARWGLARGYSHPQVTSGLPLLDGARGADAFAAMLAWLGRHHPHLAGLLLRDVPVDGGFAKTLAGPALRLLGVRLLGERQRAVLRHRRGLPSGPAPVSLRHRKELRRQRRRLAEAGPLVYRSARSPVEVAAAIERFMALEARGWKGRHGAPLLLEPALATFTRVMTRLMAEGGRCRIDALEVGGAPVAMGIVLTAGPQAYFWKTTYDERFAALSPGVHFALELTQVQEKEAGITSTDSCAIPDHPMIDRVWNGRAVVADLAIALPHRPPASRAFRYALGRETLYRALRRVAKRGWHALRWRVSETRAR